MNHPKPKVFIPAEVMPSVHWANYQKQITRTAGSRRIYDFEFIYVAAGQIALYGISDDHPLTAGEGDLLLIPSALEHRNEIVGESETHLIGVHFSFFYEDAPLSSQEVVVRGEQMRPELVCHLPVDTDGHPYFQPLYCAVPPDVSDMLEGIVRELAYERQGYELLCRSYLLHLIHTLVQLHAHPERSKHPKYAPMIWEVAARMEAHPEGNWANSVTVQELYISTDYYVRLFKDIVGMSPNKYLQSVRHRKARQLLAETNRTIAEIGRCVGYEDLQNFSKIFKSWEGISPREYRNKNLLL